MRFTSGEIAELNAAVRAFEIKSQRLPDPILALSGLEASPKKYKGGQKCELAFRNNVLEKNGAYR